MTSPMSETLSEVEFIRSITEEILLKVEAIAFKANAKRTGSKETQAGLKFTVPQTGEMKSPQSTIDTECREKPTEINRSQFTKETAELTQKIFTTKKQ